MRTLVVLYHMGDAMARAMEMAGADSATIVVWCAEWEEATTGAAGAQNLGWLLRADGLVRLVNRYHTILCQAQNHDQY